VKAPHAWHFQTGISLGFGRGSPTGFDTGWFGMTVDAVDDFVGVLL